jgi:hypothetical protein
MVSSVFLTRGKALPPHEPSRVEVQGKGHLRSWAKGIDNNMCLLLYQQGVCHTMALPFALKSILTQKKNYKNSNISPCKNIIFKKSFKRNQNPSTYYNSIINLNFQHKPKYHLSKILI